MHGVRNGCVVGQQARLARLVVVGRDQQQCVGTVGLSLLGQQMAYFVSLEPVPAITGTRPAAF